MNRLRKDSTLVLIGYHADDEIRHVEVIGEITLALSLVVIAIVLVRRLAGARTTGVNRMARFAAVVVAVGLAAYVPLRMDAFGEGSRGVVLMAAFAAFYTTWLAGLMGPILASFGLGRVRTDGEARLAALAFVASLILPGILVTKFAACVATDACFH